MVDVVEKKVSALNGFVISFFKQGATSNHGVGSPRINTSLVCQICNAINHITIVCLRIGDLKPKCDKCRLLHWIENIGFICGYCTNMGHAEDMCWKKNKDTKPHVTTNNYLEMLMDDETTTFE